ncbi:conserved hypothetical protein [Culex quinquefasciatus]|uniref:Secreted protein n=1 Tax=Culex quinquefasciatus TaxID=7176 RepID=B0WTS0_CULQU|nr:conserved hypothetical protein [Culex quinquefasciatus]|eukprot:XP_001855546.1 conserved hypothetical protein [Culex quinquefasciatus]
MAVVLPLLLLLAWNKKPLKVGIIAYEEKIPFFGICLLDCSYEIFPHWELLLPPQHFITKICAPFEHGLHPTTTTTTTTTGT